MVHPPSGLLPLTDPALDRVTTMIYDKVGRGPPTPVPDWVKVAKPTPPEAYDGKDKVQEFEMWLDKVLEYFATLGLQGPANDKARLGLLSNSLSGRAAQWYYTNVRAPNREIRDWTFEGVVVHLHRRFVREDVARKASDTWDTLRYDWKGGVADLDERIKRCTEKMVEPPSQYDQRRKLYDVLPQELRHILSMLHLISPEHHRYEEIYARAAAIEATSEWQERIREHVRERPRVPPPLVKGHGLLNFLSKGSPINRPHPVDRPRPNGLATAPHHDKDRHANSHAAPSNTNTKPPGGPNPGHVRPVGPGPNKGQMTCYKCGEVGHIAPNCPQKSDRPAPRMFAQRVVDDREDEDAPTPAPEGAAGTDGTTALGDGVQDDAPPLQDGSDSESDPGDGARYPQSDYEPYGSQYDSAGEDWDASHDVGYSVDEYSPGARLGSMFMGAMQAVTPAARHDSTEAHRTTDRVARCLLMGTLPSSRTAKAAWLHDPRIRRVTGIKDQPLRQAQLQRTLSAEIEVNGVTAWVLFDSGCTIDSITPELAYLCRADRVDLVQQIGLQLGTKGSKTQINYGARATMRIGSTVTERYFDVVDIDRYDAILGTVFCNEYGATLDFARHEVRFGSEILPTYTVMEEAEMAQHRQDRRRDRFETHLRAAQLIPPDAAPRASVAH